MSRTNRRVAHASRVLVSDLSTPAETRANREKFATARTPSPAREARALPDTPESEQTQKRKCVLFSSALPVEREVQLQHVDSRITKKAEISPFGVLLDQLANF